MKLVKETRNSCDIHDDSGWCRRADLNGDGIINIQDVSIISTSWSKTWTDTPPP